MAVQVLATGRPAVGDIFYGSIAREKLIAVAVPLLREGKVVKVLIATFDLRHFQDRIEQVAMPPEWGLTLLDAQQEVIAHRKSTSPVPTNDAEPFRRIVVKTAASSWSVMLEIPRASYFAPMMDAGIALGVGLFIAALIGIGGGLWGTRRISRAVSSLSERSHTPADGPEIAEIAAVRQRIEDASRRIASFAGAQDQAIEQERRRVAREVHDQMGQVFTAIRMIVQSFPRDAMPANQEQALNQALEMGIASARKISSELRPPLLDDLGLAAAVEYFSKELTRSTDLTCVVDLSDQERLCGPQALTLFRIIQEAFNNILRHANALYVEINGHAANGHYFLLIEDDGKGFDIEAVRQGAMGLVNMRERARLMNGQCEITVRPTGGTIVAVSLPLDKALSGNCNEIATG